MTETLSFVAARAPEAAPPGRAPRGNGPGGRGLPFAAGSVARGDLGAEKSHREQERSEANFHAFSCGDGSHHRL